MRGHLEFPIRVMDIREICAENIRAMSDRVDTVTFMTFSWL